MTDGRELDRDVALHAARVALEPDATTITRYVEQATGRIARHLASLGSMPAADVDGAVEQAVRIVEPLPEEGTELETLLDVLFDQYVPRSFNTAGPGYLAYIPGGGIFHAALGSLIADSVNRYVGVAAAAPLLVQLEANVIRWFAGILGMPDGAGGVLTTGGSIANLIAIVAARVERLPEDFLNGTMYVSEHVHHSVSKAATIAGFPRGSIRPVPVDEAFRMRVDALEAMIAADRAAGRTPFLVVGSAGTTNTGAVDDLEGLGAIARRESLWFHVDAAYGGFFMLTARGREAMRGIERADSVTLDPHKGLFLPYGIGSLVVRDPSKLYRAFGLHADYMPAMQTDGAIPDFCEMSPELSRGFRGLRVWLPLRMTGAAAFRAMLDEKLDLARWATERLREIKGIEIVAEPQLSLVAFRLVPAGATDLEADVHTTRLVEEVNRRGRVMITGTTLDGRFAARICVLSFRTHLERMEMALEDIAAAAMGGMTG